VEHDKSLKWNRRKFTFGEKTKSPNAVVFPNVTDVTTLNNEIFQFTQDKGSGMLTKITCQPILNEDNSLTLFFFKIL
jgi:hypothetical protein